MPFLKWGVQNKIIYATKEIFAEALKYISRILNKHAQEILFSKQLLYDQLLIVDYLILLTFLKVSVQYSYFKVKSFKFLYNINLT